MSDLAAVLMAVAAAAGAWVPRPVPLLVAAGVVAVALVGRRPLVLIVGIGLATSGLAARAWAGLTPPAPHHVEGTMTLVGDPQRIAGALVVDVRLAHQRLEAWARGRIAGALEPRLAGERVWLSGEVEAVPPGSRALLATRHIAARLTVDEAGAWSPGALPSRVANGARRTLVAGASSLPVGARSLFAGFVLGANRDQPPEVTYDFRASGLTHLLVVSGENVAFVLALAGPVLRRLGLRGRLVVGIAVLAFFGVLTRWEPSVLRAVAMASISLLAAALGRPVSSLRMLALAVTALIAIDPLLVHAVGFQLSVGACVGISLLAAPLARRLPGPRPVAEALAVTLAAQAGVAPIMIPAFGGLPVATLVANVLALPAAGPLMVWGVAAGLPAGVVGGWPAAAAHLPTHVMVWWVATVARVTAAVPLGRVGLLQVAVVGAGIGMAVVAAHRGRAAVAAAATSVAVLAGGVAPAWAALRPGTLVAAPVGPGATLWRRGTATVLVLEGASGSADRLMADLNAADVRTIGVLVATGTGSAEALLVETVRRRFPARLVVAPPGTRVLDAVVPPPEADVEVGPFAVHIVTDGNRLSASVGASRPRSPPG